MIRLRFAKSASDHTELLQPAVVIFSSQPALIPSALSLRQEGSVFAHYRERFLHRPSVKASAFSPDALMYGIGQQDGWKG